LRNFQPPIDGDEIIRIFGLKPGRQVGLIKNAIREAILDGIIPNEREAALKFMLDKGREEGLSPLQEVISKKDQLLLEDGH